MTWARRVPYDQIIAKRMAGAALRDLAAEYKISVTHVCLICKPERPAAKPGAPALKKKKCLNCRAEVSLPKELFMCEDCRAWAKKHG